MSTVAASQHTNRSNVQAINNFFVLYQISEQELIKVEASRGYRPIFHLTNAAFKRLAQSSTKPTEKLGVGGNVHKSAVMNGVEIVSVFRSAYDADT